MSADLEVVLRGRDFLSNNLKNAKLNVDSLALSARKLHATFGVALGLTAAVAIGNHLRNMTKNSMEFADQIDTVSGKLNMSTDSVQKWDYVLRLNKSSIEQAQKGFHKISVSAFEAATGSKESQNAFKSLGIQIHDSNGQLKNASQLTNEAVFALADMRDKTYAAGLAQKLFGKAAIELNPILAMGSAEIKKQMAEAEKYGQILDTRTIKSMADAKDSAERMDHAFKVATANLTVALAPALIKTADLAAMAAAKISDVFNYDDSERLGDIDKQINRAKKQIQDLSDPSLLDKVLASSEKYNLIDLIVKPERMDESVSHIKERTQKFLKKLEDQRREIQSQISSSGSTKTVPSLPPPSLPGKAIPGKAINYPVYEGFQEGKRQREEAEKEEAQKGLEALRLLMERDKQYKTQVIESERLLTEARLNLTEDGANREYMVLAAKYTTIRDAAKDNATALANIDRAYAADRIALDRMVLQTQIQNARAGADQMVGSLQTVAARWKEFAGIYKAIATAQAIWDTYSGATASYKAMAGIPYVGPALGAVAAAAAIAGGVANVASIQAAKFGLGADYYTSGPQLIMVGENPGRREHVQITPESSPNINGPSGNKGNPMNFHFYDSSGRLSESIQREIRQGESERLIEHLASEVLIRLR